MFSDCMVEVIYVYIFYLPLYCIQRKNAEYFSENSVLEKKRPLSVAPKASSVPHIPISLVSLHKKKFEQACNCSNTPRKILDFSGKVKSE